MITLSDDKDTTTTVAGRMILGRPPAVPAQGEQAGFTACVDFKATGRGAFQNGMREFFLLVVGLPTLHARGLWAALAMTKGCGLGGSLG